ncbi:MAG: GNAT family N-acetyltransferase [Bacteroidetes bacterium]|nr:GNAT family N-acetyltransferase [Bacteroidota bacterium]
MTLFLSKIERRDWQAQLKYNGPQNKWFYSVNNNNKSDFFGIYILQIDVEKTQIGSIALNSMEDIMDCSIFIFPEYQRQGYATKCISVLISTYDNIQFTVSMYNENSLRFFESIDCLNKTVLKEQNRTFIFRKFKNPTAKEISL